MNDEVLGEVIAGQIRRNRGAGWLRHAVDVMEASPYLRRDLIEELAGVPRSGEVPDGSSSVAARLREVLPGRDHRVEARRWSDSGWFFIVDVKHREWGDVRVGLANWTENASLVGIGVYSSGENDMDGRVVERLREAMKPRVWVRTLVDRQWVNVSTNPRDWGTPAFLRRIVEDPKRVAGDVAQQVAKVVTQVDPILRER